MDGKLEIDKRIGGHGGFRSLLGKNSCILIESRLVSDHVRDRRRDVGGGDEEFLILSLAKVSQMGRNPYSIDNPMVVKGNQGKCGCGNVFINPYLKRFPGGDS
jgi:hypothetical protein